MPTMAQVGQIEQSGSYDRARLGYFANRVLVYELLSDADNTVLYTVPGNTTVLIRSMWALNNSGGASTLYFKILPAGQTASSWPCKTEESVSSKDTLEWWQIDEVLEPGYQLIGWCDNNQDILLKINGVYVGGQ